MARWLAARGHGVTVVTAEPRAEPGAARIVRCLLVAPSASGAVATRVRHVSFAMASAPALIGEAAAVRPDIVGSLTPSAAAASSALAAARFARAPAWLHLEEDAEPLGIEAMFAFVSLAALDAEAMLDARGVASEASLSLPAWTDTFAIAPAAEPSALRQALAHDDEIVALYVGDCSERAARILLEAARTVPPHGAIRFIAACAGTGLAALVAAAPDLPQLAVLSLPPPEWLGELLPCADIHLLPEGVSRPDPRIRGKLGALLASGRPVVACGRTARLAAPIEEAIATVEGAGEDMALAVVALAADEDSRRRRGRAARVAAEAYFAQERAFRTLEKRLEALASRG